MMILIEYLDIEELGSSVCSVFNEELGIQLYFDYIQVNDDFLFRFFNDKDFIVDFMFSEMIQKFKTLDWLVVNLLALMNK